jgi:hypothetical protein
LVCTERHRHHSVGLLRPAQAELADNRSRFVQERSGTCTVFLGAQPLVVSLRHAKRPREGNLRRKHAAGLYCSGCVNRTPGSRPRETQRGIGHHRGPTASVSGPAGGGSRFIQPIVAAETAVVGEPARVGNSASRNGVKHLTTHARKVAQTR